MIDWSKGLPESVGDQVTGWVEASPETRGYWDGVARDELTIKRCSNCNIALHPRRIACPDCGSIDIGWSKASGWGEVYTFSEIHRSPRPELQNDLPYCVGIIHLEEDVFLYSRIVDGTGGGYAIGQRGEFAFEPVGEFEKLPVFHTKVS